MKSHIARSFRKIISFATTTLVKKYLQKDRTFTYKDFKLIVLKDVFHPGLFRSTKVFAEWIEQQDISNKKILEIGSGAGLLALVAAKKGAIVTAVDINPKAVENTKLNATANGLNVTVLQSDLMAAVSEKQFDLVLINPPYYPKQPGNDYGKAWYCGENFEYFANLFQQLKQYGLTDRCYLILSDTCDLVSIAQVARQHTLQLLEVKRKKISGEQLIIYKTTSIAVNTQ
jgi:release factor glutamine methyltransferase